MTFRRGIVRGLPARHGASGKVLPKLLVLLALLLVGVVAWMARPLADQGLSISTSSATPAVPRDDEPEQAPLLFPAPSKITGSKLQGGLWRTASTAPRAATPGREAMLEDHLPGAIASLREGESVRLPLFDGMVAEGKVNLVQHETGGWFRVAGSLEAPHGGAFALATNGTEVGGLIQFPSRNLAFEIVVDPTRGPILRERLLSDVLCLPLPRPDFEPAPADSGVTTLQTALPLLSSRPEAAAVFFLDFDGETVSDPSWYGGRTIVAKAPSLSAQQIQQIWQRVKEDYWPFNVDVTTNPARYTGAAVRHRMRCIITPTDTASPGAGGVAYIDSFSEAGTGKFSTTIPCWVFNSSVTGIAEAISHELGHTLGLRHDGRSSPAQEYYAGQGSGATGWAPIMGVGYNKALVQWSKGEYLNANNKQDDLAIIAGTSNAFGYVGDEAGDTVSTATSLALNGTEVEQNGIITTVADRDVYVFATGAGVVNLAANPAPLSPNLDVLLELLDGSGQVIASNNPADQLNASISATVAAGNYYVRVRGSGKGDAQSTGYSSYASIGAYTIRGDVPGGTAAPVITSAPTAAGERTLPFTYQITATSAPTSYTLSGSLPAGLTFNQATGTISGVPTEIGSFNLTMGAANSAGADATALTISIFQLQAPGVTSAATATGALGIAFTYQVSASRPPSSYGLSGTLPGGLSFDGTAGLISGTPTTVGVFPVTVSAANEAGTGSALVSISITELPPPEITSADFVSARVGAAFSYEINASGNPNAFDVEGTLPGGLTFDPGTRRITGNPTSQGLFTVIVTATNPYGTGTKELKIDVAAQALDLTEALDQQDLTWATSGDRNWAPDTAVTRDGADSAKISGLDNRETGVLQTQIEGPASFRFFWKVSSEKDYDCLSFSVDGQERFRISGEVDWQLISVPIPAGTHQIRFAYQKDSYESAGEDAAWLDQVVVLPREGHAGSDSFAGAQALTGSHVAISTNNIDATIEAGEPAPLPGNFSHSLWWSWTAPETGSVAVSTNGSSFDTLLAVYSGSELGSLTRIAANDDIGRKNHASQTLFRAIAGQTYFITVAGYSTAAGDLRLALHYINTGDYVGVALPEGDTSALASELRLRVTRNLAYTGSVYFRGRRYPVRGSLSAGTEARTISRGKSLAPLNLTLSTDLSNGDNAIAGTLTDGVQSYQAIARRRITRSDLSSLAAGSYNVLLEAGTLGSTLGYGSGYGRAVVSSRGNVRFTGALGDGRNFSQGGVLTSGSIWPCFLAPYRGELGTLAGEVRFDPVAPKNFTGALTWRVENGPATFADEVELTGCYHFPPTDQYPTLAVNYGALNVQLFFEHRNPSASPNNLLFTFVPTNLFKGLPPGYQLSVNPRNGLISGFLPDPVTRTRQPFSGIVLEVENRGGGFFNSAAGMGRFDLAVKP